VLIEAPNPETGELVLLFNPRQQKWTEHFEWNEAGTHILGKTAIGKTTIQALDLNSQFRVLARALWVEAGWHPPSDGDKQN